jgi:hypothetical protein
MSLDYSKNLKTFISDFSVKDLRGQEKFLVLAASLSGGDISQIVKISDIKHSWLKSILKGSYNSSFYFRAIKEGWVDSDKIKNGICYVTDFGLDYLNKIVVNKMTETFEDGITKLMIFDKKETHSIDKVLRDLFSKATKCVCIADSWVDKSIFSTVLDAIPKSIKIQLIYGQTLSADKIDFEARKNRFNIQWPNFNLKRYKHLHDRFFIIDDNGYIIGPSLKDAASHSPALLISLPKTETVILQKFFNKLWTQGK